METSLLFIKNSTPVNESLVGSEVKRITENTESLNSVETLKKIFSCIDLTTLNTQDTQEKARQFAEKVTEFPKVFPNIPNVAAICVYPSLVSTVRAFLKVPNVGIASVVGGFPSSQTFIDVKCVETSFAFNVGATEADMVISVGEFLSGDYDLVYDEIIQIKDACGDGHLKVILETGALENLTNIKTASMIAMEAGGDFIKTSTGKLNPSATLEAVYVMAQAAKEFFEKTGRKVGIKPAGGISDAQTALKYYAVIKDVLGEEWLTPGLFRIGASSLANNLLTEINRLNGLQDDIHYF
jgi:deoxyribose-phosphate aldolase